MTDRTVLRMLVALTGVIFLVAGCGDSTPKQDPHAGQGQEVTADPAFEISLTIDGQSPMVFAAEELGVYQAKPAKDAQPMKQQTFALEGNNCIIAGALPADLKLAPARTFKDLEGKTLAIFRHGGDPSLPAMTKITLPDGRVLLGQSGTLTVEKAFFRRGQYAGISGKFELELQEVKLGDPEDAKSKGDQPVGSPVKAKGTFTSKAGSYEFTQL